jgi:hypothetical protein
MTDERSLILATLIENNLSGIMGQIHDIKDNDSTHLGLFDSGRSSVASTVVPE